MTVTYNVANYDERNCDKAPHVNMVNSTACHVESFKEKRQRILKNIFPLSCAQKYNSHMLGFA
jgi:hypothetical protein